MTTQKAIIYDDTCPMCRWYTNKFVKAGLLEQENRISFAELEHKNLVDQIDMERGRDEIPLVDLEGGRTIYGLDSMVFLLTRRLPWLPKVLAIPPIDWFFRKLYKFVSYNRRIMAPSAKQAVKYDCTPHFNWTYRLLYLFFAFGTGGSLLAGFTLSFLPAFAGSGLLAICFLVLLQSLAFEDIYKRMDYLGQAGTVTLLAGLVVIPAFYFPIFIMACTFTAAAMIIWQWKRRLRLLMSV